MAFESIIFQASNEHGNPEALAQNHPAHLRNRRLVMVQPLERHLNCFNNKSVQSHSNDFRWPLNLFSKVDHYGMRSWPMTEDYVVVVKNGVPTLCQGCPGFRSNI